MGKGRTKHTFLVECRISWRDDIQEVDTVIKANRPDIVVLDEKERKALIIDVTIPMDINMIKAAA
eukprot:9644233-Ditylum_brightwellii.AAC.1